MCVTVWIKKLMHQNYTWCCPSAKDTPSPKTPQSPEHRTRTLSPELGSGHPYHSCWFPRPSSPKGLLPSMLHALYLVRTFHTALKMLPEMSSPYLHFWSFWWCLQKASMSCLWQTCCTALACTLVGPPWLTRAGGCQRGSMSSKTHFSCSGAACWNQPHLAQRGSHQKEAHLPPGKSAPSSGWDCRLQGEPGGRRQPRAGEPQNPWLRPRLQPRSMSSGSRVGSVAVLSAGLCAACVTEGWQVWKLLSWNLWSVLSVCPFPLPKTRSQ